MRRTPPEQILANPDPAHQGGSHPARRPKRGRKRLTFPAARVNHGESLLAEIPGSGIANPGSSYICWMSRHTPVALRGCLRLGQPAPHYRHLGLVGYLRPRRVDVLAPPLGVMREDLVVDDALSPFQIVRACVLANPCLRWLVHQARLLRRLWHPPTVVGTSERATCGLRGECGTWASGCRTTQITPSTPPSKPPAAP